MRIGHLTDIHVWDPSTLRARDFLTKRATGWVNYTRKRAAEYDPTILRAAVARLVEARPDLVVVSGDLTNLGLVSELEAARAILQPIADAGLRLAVVPGNHDYYVRDAARGGFEEVFAAWQQGDAREAGATYPWVVRGEGASVVLMNSALPLPPFFAAGWLGEAQLARAARLAGAERDAGRSVVLVTHHHPTRAPARKLEWTRRLRDAAALRRVARDVGACLLLHGHNHHLHVRRMDGPAGPLICGISSGTTNRREPPERRGMVGLYDVGVQGIRALQVARWGGEAFGAWETIDAAGASVEQGREALDA